MVDYFTLLLIIANFIAIIMVLISAFFYFRLKIRRMKLMLLFWCAYLTYFLYTYLTIGMAENIIAAASFAWILRLIAIRKIIEDITADSLKKPWHKYVLSVAAAITLILIVTQTSLTLMTVPLALGVSIVGMNITFQGFRDLKEQNKGELHYILLSVFALIFVHTFTYPYMRLGPILGVIGYGLVLFTTFLVAIFIPTILFVDQEKDNMLLRLKVAEEKHQYTMNLARVLLTIRDRISTPLQTLDLLKDSFAMDNSIDESRLEIFDRSLKTMIENNKQYQRLESLIDWHKVHLMSNEEVDHWLEEVEKGSLKPT